VAVPDPRERFAATAHDYQRHRPDYPAALIDWLRATTGLRAGAAAADVGCGTGLSTRFLLGGGFDVVGIDPSEQMLGCARATGGARYLKGEAAATGLAGGSVDLVSVAQAFHWFDVAAALAEFRRVLKPGGWTAAFWNVRDRSPLLDEYETLLRRHSSEYADRPKPADAIAKIRRAVGSLHEAEFRNEQRLDRDGLLGRAHSSSYVAHGVPDRAALDRELGDLFDRRASQGEIVFLYRTLAFLWQGRQP